jgi:hypothetical protein
MAKKEGDMGYLALKAIEVRETKYDYSIQHATL